MEKFLSLSLIFWIRIVQMVACRLGQICVLVLYGLGMAVSRQELLKEAWLGGREGYMSGQTQARAWALREVWRDENGEKTYGMLTHIAIPNPYKNSTQI